MLNLLKRCFNAELETEAWQIKLKKMIPSYGQSLLNNPALCDELRVWTTQVLELREMELA